MKKIIHTIIGVLFSIFVMGQQTPIFNLNSLNPISYNPALAGTSTKVRASLMTRQWLTSMPGRPVSNMLTADGQIGSNPMGWGITVFQENLGITSRTAIYGNYAYHLKVADEHKLHFGLALGGQQSRIIRDDVVAKDVQDPTITDQSYREAAIDGSFGLVYDFKNLEIGFGINQLFGNKVEYQINDANVSYSMDQHYFSTIRYKFYGDRQRNLEISPIITFRAVSGAPMPQEGQVIATWKDQFIGGVGYKSAYGFNFLAGVKITKDLQIAYSYDVITAPIGGYAGASHELSIGYSFSILSKQMRKQQKQIDKLAHDLADYKKLQNETDELQTEILKAQQDQLENSQDQIDKNTKKIEAVDQNAKQTKESLDVLIEKLKEQGVIKSSSKEEYQGSVKIGYYLVIASVHQDNYNEESMNDEFLKKGYSKVFNEQRGWHYVYTQRYDDLESSLRELNVVRRGKLKDAWVHIIQ